MNRARPASIAIAVSIAAALFSSCATSIPVEVMKPAEINMSGARTVAVLDFDYPRQYRGSGMFEMLGIRIRGTMVSGRDSLERELASYATSRLISALFENDYFTVVDSGFVASRLSHYDGSGELSAVEIGRSSSAQAIIIGEITKAERELKVEVVKERVKDPDTGEYVDVYESYTTATDKVGLQYRVVDAATGVIIATRSFERSASDRAKTSERNRIPSAESVMKGIIDSWIPKIQRQIAPYRITEYRTLASDKTKDPEMKAADELARSGAYDAALNRFLGIYNATRNPAAGINAAIMMDVTGRIDDAISMMAAVLEDTGDKAASRELSRLKQTKRDMEEVAEQMQ